MAIVKFKMVAAWSALAVSVLAASAIVSTQALAQTPAIDPAAVQILKRMTGYLGNLKQFSAHTQNSVEDLLESGQRIDEVVSANVVISRPNKLRAERKGDLLNQTFYYDGKHLTLYDPANKVYATVDAPATIEEMIDFARETLGLQLPVADLLFRNAFPLLMQDVTSATVIGKSFISGVECTHLAFRRPGVDFQMWVADAGDPLPYRYVVTDTSTPALVSITSLISEWNVAPDVADDRFTFVPPPGAKSIEFVSPNADVASSR